MSGTDTSEDEAAARSSAPEPASAWMSTRRLRRPLEWAVLLVLALAVSWGLRTYALQTFYIPSGSMEPTLQVGDRIIVNKLAVDFGTIHRGDILVFKSPPREDCGEATSTDLVKRVIGLPGDSLYSTGDVIFVDGHALKERWGHLEPLGPVVAPANKPVIVPLNHYFMMGDNHPNSCDSRIWGTIDRSSVIGKAFLRLWPPTRIGTL